MKKIIEELLKTLKSSSLTAYLQDNKDELSDNLIAEYLILAMEEKGLKKGRCYKKPRHPDKLCIPNFFRA